MKPSFVIFTALVSSALSATAPVSADILSAVLPNVRSVLVGHTATAFATIINSGPTMVTDCGISLDRGLSADFFYQTTNGATNELIGIANTPVNIAAGQAQSYLIAVTAENPVSAVELQLNFHCSSGLRAANQTGVNTLQFSASSTLFLTLSRSPRPCRTTASSPPQSVAPARLPLPHPTWARVRPSRLYSTQGIHPCLRT